MLSEYDKRIRTSTLSPALVNFCGALLRSSKSLFGYLFWKQFYVSKTAKRVFEGYMSVWLVVFKTKTSKTKTPEKHEIRKQL
jgi:hypothetical protein